MRKKLSIKFKIFIIGLLSVIIVFTAAAAFVFIPSNVYNGVKCAGVNIGGMTYDKIIKALQEEHGSNPSGGTIKLLLEDKSFSLATDDIDVQYDYEKSALNALKFGHDGSFFPRVKLVLHALFSGYEVPLEFSYNEAKLNSYIEKMLEGIGTPVVEYSYEVLSGKLYITNGSPGDMPDKDEVCNALLNTIGTRRFDEKLIFKKQERLPEGIDVETLFAKLHGAPADAYYERMDNEIIIVPHKYGIDFDKVKAEEIIKMNTAYGKTFEIPAIITEPSVLAEDLKKRLFSQTLGSYKTNFNTGAVARCSNIYLASSKINNFVMMPGEVFSYNGIVGERSKETGFEMAQVYMNNEVVDGIGGGICQVSSTLYCATLYSNLEIVERVNHQLTVSYVPLGQDATVDYGNIDFRFKNNTSYPIKIVSRAEGSQIEVSIVGYREKPEKVEISNVTVSTIPPTVKEEVDPELPIGEKKVKSQGGYGSVVETYKVVTIDGVKGERKLVSKSTYGAGKTLMAIGTKPVEDKDETDAEKAESNGGLSSAETMPRTQALTGGSEAATQVDID